MAWIIMCHRTSGSRLGAASAPMREAGKIRIFGSAEVAASHAAHLNQEVKSKNLSYTVETWDLWLTEEPPCSSSS